MSGLIYKEVNLRFFKTVSNNYKNIQNLKQQARFLHSHKQVIDLSRCSTGVLISKSFSWPHYHNKHSSNFCSKSHQQTLALSGVLQVRFNSGNVANSFQNSSSVGTGTDATQILPGGYVDLPDVPAPPVKEAIEVTLNSLGEPTFSSIGLCNYTSPGLIQKIIESIHVFADLPWIPTLMIATIIMRMVIFPVFIKGRKATISYSNHMPTVQKLQQRIQRARAEGDIMEAIRLSRELNDFMSRNNINLFGPLITPLVQGPIFISMIFAIRGMVYAPVESLKTAGLWWFPDLTAADPYLILPALSAVSALMTFEVGADSNATKNMKPAMRWFLRLMPFAVIPLMYHQPSAIFVYWFSNNIFSLCQVALLKHPAIKKRFNMPEPVRHEQPEVKGLPKKAPKGVKAKVSYYKKKMKKSVQNFRDAREASKKISEIENRAKAEAREWKKAGSAPIVKTFSYDPTKVKR